MLQTSDLRTVGRSDSFCLRSSSEARGAVERRDLSTPAHGDVFRFFVLVSRRSKYFGPHESPIDWAPELWTTVSVPQLELPETPRRRSAPEVVAAARERRARLGTQSIPGEMPEHSEEMLALQEEAMRELAQDM